MPDIGKIREEDCASLYCSTASTNETADNLPGPGRILGNIYVALGRRLENGIGLAAGKMGIGPRAIALKIRKVQEDRLLSGPKRFNKLEKYSKQTAKYLK